MALPLRPDGCRPAPGRYGGDAPACLGSAPLASVPRGNRLAIASWSVLLLAAVIQLGATAAQMSDLPFAQVFHGDVLAGVLKGTHFGAVWQVRIALLGGLLVTGLMEAWRSGARAAV